MIRKIRFLFSRKTATYETAGYGSKPIYISLPVTVDGFAGYQSDLSHIHRFRKPVDTILDLPHCWYSEFFPLIRSPFPVGQRSFCSWNHHLKHPKSTFWLVESAFLQFFHGETSNHDNSFIFHEFFPVFLVLSVVKFPCWLGCPGSSVSGRCWLGPTVPALELHSWRPSCWGPTRSWRCPCFDGEIIEDFNGFLRVFSGIWWDFHGF